jgi:CRISPR/Cas system-associated exonuclease Cas4 (RecB family)
VQYSLLTQLSEEGLLPLFHPGEKVRGERLARAREALAEVLAEVAKNWKDLLAPAIDRVWADGIASIDADLRGWLDLASKEPRWAPHRFELAFGLPDRGHHDPHSTLEPAALDSGLRLRGSIDLVERATDGALRATDSKTGKVRAEQGMVIDGGRVLQPALYALVLEKLERDRQARERAQGQLAGLHPAEEPSPLVEAGRLYYCTHVGDYTEVVVPLGPPVRDVVKRLAETLQGALAEGFFPVAPDKDECMYCDFKEVCGDGEEKRAARKPKDRLAPLLALRSEP